VIEIDLLIEKLHWAVQGAQRRLGVLFDHDEIEDATQSAAEGFWRAWRKRPGNVGYAAVSARREVIKFFIRHLWGSNPLWTKELTEDTGAVPLLPTQAEELEGLPDEILRDLQRIFLESRAKRGRRGARATAREVFITNALQRQWNNEAIATALGTSVDAVKKYWHRIKRVLTQELERRNENDGDTDLHGLR